MSRKSPQEKKQLDYTKGHFTGGFDSSRMFPKTWKRKKTQANRQYRRRTQELLAELKAGMGEDDVMSDDLTAARFQRSSISRKRLHKVGTVTLGEKVQLKLEKRTALVGRKVRTKRSCDSWARSALTTLNALQGERFVEVARRAQTLGRWSTDERLRVMRSQDPVDRALEFLNRISGGSAHEIYALRRSPALQKGFLAWLKKAERAATRGKPTQASKSPKSNRRKDSPA